MLKLGALVRFCLLLGGKADMGSALQNAANDPSGHHSWESTRPLFIVLADTP